jgi:3-oxoadipate enol-lactonase
LRANINGIELGYDDHGVGLPIIFLHAFPLNRNMWTGLTTALLNERGFRLVTLDWRGFGESNLHDRILTMEQFADDVAALMDMLGMQQAVLCGLSMGGYAAFALLRKYPRRVRGLVLCDTRPGADTAEAKANRELVARLVEEQGVDAFANLQIPKLLSEYTLQHHSEIERRVRQMINVATPDSIAAASRGMALRTDSTDLLATITCPTLVVVGEYDSLTPPAVAQEYARSIPGAQVAIVPLAGHLSNLEQPDAFLEAVRPFLISLA